MDPLATSYTHLHVTYFDFYKITGRRGFGANAAIFVPIRCCLGTTFLLNSFIINSILQKLVNYIVFSNMSGGIENLALTPLCFQ